MKYTASIEEAGLSWFNVIKQTDADLSMLQKRFHLLEQDIEESKPVFQRPKMIKRAHYYFIVLHFPVFDRSTRRLTFTEVDFFLQENVLITIHDNKLFALDNFFKECKKNAETRRIFFSGNGAHLLFELLSRLFEAIFPLLLHVNEDITNVDKALFKDVSGRKTAEEVLRLKTNVVTFRRTMQGHRLVLDRFISLAGREYGLFSLQSYIYSLRESINEIWHILESEKESINALHETNESLINLHTNDVMKTLTIISVVTFPLTLVATIFAIHAPGTPFIQNELGFWIIFGLILVGALGMVVLFKKRSWL
jgi:magnesium transporter